jgi:hypothetical protein
MVSSQRSTIVVGITMPNAFIIGEYSSEVQKAVVEGASNTSISKRIFLGLFTILMIAPAVTAANTQGLKWGVNQGAKLEYSIHIEDNTGDGYSLTEDFYVRIDFLPELSPSVTEVGDALLTGERNVSFFLMNDTPTEGIAEWSLLPVGNWSLIAEIFEPILDGFDRSLQYIDTSSEWGFSYSESGSSITTEVTTTWSKTDGAVNWYLKDQRDTSNEALLYHAELLRAGYKPVLGAVSTIAAITGIGVIGIAALLYIIRKRRSRIYWTTTDEHQSATAQDFLSH